jgi:hypothetical protein
MEPTSGLEPLTRSSSRLRRRVVAEQSLDGDPPVRTPYHQDLQPFLEDQHVGDASAMAAERVIGLAFG